MMKLSVRTECWPMRHPLKISGYDFQQFDTVVVELEQDGFVGRGEGMPVFYLGQTAPALLAGIEAVRPQIEAGASRTDLISIMAPDGARNAVDCALWDLEAKRSGYRVWELAGIAPRQLEYQLSLSIGPGPEAMAEEAAASGTPRLKLKLNDDRPIERLAAVRKARPDARLRIDVNEGWSCELLERLLPELVGLGVDVIEQPLPRGGDAALSGVRSPIAICADESCLHLGELRSVADRYDMINIKLDKAGGLTHALELARAARDLGLGVMAGCMGGGSLATAPACILAAVADIADLDGPLWQRSDRLPGLTYRDGLIGTFGPEVWG